MAANLVEAFEMQCDDRRQRGNQHLLPSAGVNLLHLLIYANNTEIQQCQVYLLKQIF